MQHSFIASQINPESCAKCARSESDHTDKAICESCDAICNCEIIDDILMCPKCQSRQAEINAELAKLPDNWNKKVPGKTEIDQFLIKSEQIDSSIQTSEMFFNSRTVSIAALEEAIKADDTIEKDKKYFELATRVSNRFKHLKENVLPERKLNVENAQTELNAVASEMRAIQVYLNNLAGKLREEERAKLKLENINYQPTPPKKVSTAKLVKKYDKTEIKKYAAELDIPEFVLQSYAVAKNLSAAEAAGELKTQIAEMKKQQGK